MSSSYMLGDAQPCLKGGRVQVKSYSFLFSGGWTSNCLRRQIESTFYFLVAVGIVSLAPRFPWHTSSSIWRHHSSVISAGAKSSAIKYLNVAFLAWGSSWPDCASAAPTSPSAGLLGVCWGNADGRLALCLSPRRRQRGWGGWGGWEGCHVTSATETGQPIAIPNWSCDHLSSWVAPVSMWTFG